MGREILLFLLGILVVGTQGMYFQVSIHLIILDFTVYSSKLSIIFKLDSETINVILKYSF